MWLPRRGVKTVRNGERSRALPLFAGPGRGCGHFSGVSQRSPTRNWRQDGCAEGHPWHTGVMACARAARANVQMWPAAIRSNRLAMRLRSRWMRRYDGRGASVPVYTRFGRRRYTRSPPKRAARYAFRNIRRGPSIAMHSGGKMFSLADTRDPLSTPQPN